MVLLRVMDAQRISLVFRLKPIIKPVPPSKRAAQHDAEPESRNETNFSHDYLPRELANIIAARQRQERAWHNRLSICASIFSNIDSTLATYKEDIEKQEADIIRKYLQKALACLAASDNLAQPPKIPIESKPGKKKSSNSPSNAVLKNLSANSKPSTLPTQNINKNLEKQIVPLKQKENTWPMVAQNGHKKSRTIVPVTTSSIATGTRHQHHLPNPQHQNRENNKTKNKKTSQNENKPDDRLFVRLPADHEWRALSPAGLREVIVKRLSVSPASIGLIKPVRSGFALCPSSSESSKNLLAAAGGLFMSGATLEAASNWTSILVPTVPNRVSSKRPAFVKLYGTSKPEAPHRTWMAFFSDVSRVGFRVFDESGVTKIFKKKQPIEFCKRCNGHHNTKTCSRAPSCGNCGSTMHAQEACKALTKCRNCGGPHRSDSHRCLARPTRSGNPTKEQLKVYRQAGDREYQAVIRAIEAEAKAASAEDLDGSTQTPTDSQSSNISAINKETPINSHSSISSTINSNEARGETSSSVEMRF
ncbi:putative eka-like protein [Erysiphe necator]|uniref:Putative eka-like protein n=1 Tax=Uncinula necator TaxID=52586 RepID=A0A0B1PDB4_UNCNE|nr:putative eka-like protein [Erysiphe necator]